MVVSVAMRVSIRPERPKLSPREALRNLRRVLTSMELARRLGQKMRHDRVLMRSSALAFETLLSIVPLTAVAMGAARAFGGQEAQVAFLHYVAEQYVPESAAGAVERFVRLVENLDLSTIGLVGLAALLPVMFSLVDAVELTLSDIFRTPRRAHWWRFLFLAALLSLAPLGSVLTVRYVPWHALAYDHVLTPLVLVSTVLYGVFRRLPSVSTSDRAAVVGAVTAGILLSLAKAGFGLYATYVATSIHVLWGAIAFVPLLLVWVLMSWAIVLLGAEITACVQFELNTLELPAGSPRAKRSPWRCRLRRRLLRQHRVCAPPNSYPERPHPGLG